MSRLSEHPQLAALPMRPAPPTTESRRGVIGSMVVLVHVLVILGPFGWIVLQNRWNPPKENAFLVKIGGTELSHAYEVGPPERRRPTPNPGRRPESSGKTTPQPKEPETPRITPKAKPQPKEPVTPTVKPRTPAKPRPKATPVKPKPKAAPAKPKPQSKPSQARSANTRKNDNNTAARRPRTVEEAQKGVYRPEQQTGPIGDGGGTNTNRNVPIGRQDRGQAYGPPDNRTPAGGAKNDSLMKYGLSLGDYLKTRWEEPSRSLLEGRLPEVLIEVTIAADGRVLSSRILKPSGITAMDASVRRMLDALDRVPTPPSGRISLQLIMRTSES